MSHPRVHWLASYPRSGNTWVRTLLMRLLWGEKADFRDMQDWVMDGHAPITAQAFGRVEPKIVKTHDLAPLNVFLIDEDEAPLYREVESAGCVYVVRDPADVVCSVFDFVLLNSDFDWQARPPDERRRIFEGFVDEFVSRAGDIDYPPLKASNLNAHVASWLGLGGRMPVTVIRYEDLAADPAAEAARLAGHFGLARSRAALERAVASCAFPKMREVEEATIALSEEDPEAATLPAYSEFYKPWRRAAYRRGRRFFNRGRTGRGAERLAPSQLAALRRAFAPVIERFGY